jgi:predicted AAA+ superfamily ATPase
MYIRRQVQDEILNSFNPCKKNGIILSGVVGCGKTTLIENCLKDLKQYFEIFKFTGDDVIFRNNVKQNTKYIHDYISSITQKPVLIFIDEIQKSEEIFDAVKYAFDNMNLSFIVSGSNPDFLNTAAKKRLQRRADLLLLTPFSLPEILSHKKLIKLDYLQQFFNILVNKNKINLSNLNLSLNQKIKDIINDYLVFGGLPLVFLSKSKNNKLIEIRKVVERGFESVSSNNDNISDSIKIELAKLHSKEFSYKGLFQKIGIKRRDIVNKTIDELINHAYLIKKKPLLIGEDRKSYLSVFSYIDPGIVTYLTGKTELDGNLGPKVEGIVFSRLKSLSNLLPLKSSIHYFKPFTVDSNNKVKYIDGEIDFIFKIGERIIPIEVKYNSNINNINTSFLKNFIKKYKIPFGIVLYGGVGFYKKEDKILFWPYWLI